MKKLLICTLTSAVIMGCGDDSASTKTNISAPLAINEINAEMIIDIADTALLMAEDLADIATNRSQFRTTETLTEDCPISGSVTTTVEQKSDYQATVSLIYKNCEVEPNFFMRGAFSVSAFTDINNPNNASITISGNLNSSYGAEFFNINFSRYYIDITETQVTQEFNVSYDINIDGVKGSFTTYSAPSIVTDIYAYETTGKQVISGSNNSKIEIEHKDGMTNYYVNGEPFYYYGY